MQLKLKKDFFDVTIEPLVFILTEAFNANSHLIPGDVFISTFLNLTNFRVTELIIDEEAVPIEFHEEYNGIYLRIVDIEKWMIGIDYELWFGKRHRLSGPLEYHFNDFVMHTGIELGTESNGGIDIHLFDFTLDEGDSKFFLGNGFFRKFVASLINYTFMPLSYLVDRFMEPVFNFVYDKVLEPYILHSGDIIMPVDFYGFGDVEYDIDLAFTKQPLVTNDSIEIYLNAGITVLNEYLYDQLP
jgi:hypothetical protein